jgi:Cys-tRNA(Pro)/Cys-tRNA(Cys) deacylase
MSARATRAIDELRRAGVAHVIHEYAVRPAPGAGRGTRHGYGEEAAAALGVDPGRVFKTLVATVDERLVVAIVPVAGELDPKLLAAAVGGRRATMADAAEAERATGYVVGGISPLGQRRVLPTVIDASADDHATILVSAGRRGLQVEIAPAELAKRTAAIVAPISRPR